MGGQKTPSSSSSSSSSSWFSHFCSSALRTKPINSPLDTILVSRNSTDALVRRLGLLDLILLGVGASIGAGIFVVTGTVARDAGPGVTVSFILAGLSCVLNALCYAELASRLPAVVGGAYLYAYSAFNELTAFLVFGQLMIDYHIGAASIARSLASYVVTILEMFPVFKDNIPSWIGHGGEEFLGGTLSINLLAPFLLALLTVILCLGVGESSIVNSFMTVLKVVIVIIVIFVGAFEVDVSNWSPFAPHGVKEILTGSTVVFFAYVGFDAVANSAEESRRPQRDLPLGIIGSLVICIALYIGVCLVLTGMVPYYLLGEDAPLAEAFTSKGLKYVSILISIGAVAGLTTTLLVGLYVQSRLYLGLGRDGLLPSLFSKVHPTRHTPIHSQVWVGIVAGILGGLFNVHVLSHILSVGALTGYSVVSACVLALRWKDKTASQFSSRWTSAWREGVLCIVAVACCGFATGLFYRFSASFIFLVVAVVIAILATAALCCRQTYTNPPGFSCPGVPIVPAVCVYFNMFLFAQLHHEAWVRFVVLSIIMVGIYAFYGQYHAKPEKSHA
ncbi:PREDICTED: cationic amino acid transporter 9, chloroplastic-like isoform X3 [Populus euphratica]|uniref:Cationic amino acid transporter 9, chloroplastic-like isoform X3 n=1 Tax=Populus euphratica TaxID=75702 RepID=A0AAJ6XEH6_POPEU|nr:PREDICTED: cationic amino acid transporter 9, chloroplastic-like isoform X3 [Populus euphratica]XP_011017330.1 PREDICTED: cationic amino acid transporter 9, chloroplastic-like isoform X3 [Populus euphratica]